MKRLVAVIMAVLAASLSGCMKPAEVPEVNISPAVSTAAVQTPEESPSDIATLLPTISPSSEVSDDETELDDNNGDDDYPPVDPNIPGLLGNQWYDWDKVGAYPGASVVQCGNRIAFTELKELKGILNYDYYLSFADPDGKHIKRTKVKDANYPNYKDGWVYFVYKHNSIYKIKTDGSGLKKLFEAKSSLKGTKENILTYLLLVDNKMYVFQNEISRDSEKTTFTRMNLDGSGSEVLDEFDYTGLTKDSDLSEYLQSLFYDSGKLYYTNADAGQSKFDIYQYNISDGTKSCLVTDIVSGDTSKIAVRGDSIYYSGNEGLKVHSISTGKDEIFAPTRNVEYMDYAFFDRWLLLTGDDGIYCYDMREAKLYYAYQGGAAYIVPVRNNVYLEEIEDAPLLYHVIFKDGKVDVGDCFNLTK